MLEVECSRVECSRVESVQGIQDQNSQITLEQSIRMVYSLRNYSLLDTKNDDFEGWCVKCAYDVPICICTANAMQFDRKFIARISPAVKSFTEW